MAKIVVRDDLHPEDEAMLQALYSRSAASVEVHLNKLARTGSGKFMETYYVGYGHRSIGDCGTTTIFIEGVSVLADKAFQDLPLYSGQETSTRYIDMANQPLADPVGTPASVAILDRWMCFYRESFDAVAAHVANTYPRREGEDDALHWKAVHARAFDILRGFLPCAVTTQLSWHTSLRQAGDRLAVLRYHPLAEVREVAVSIETELRARYPHSFEREPREPIEAWRKQVAAVGHTTETWLPDVRAFTVDDRLHVAPEACALLRERPPRGEVPYWMNEFGAATFEFCLDYGSFRDLQRHRSGIRRMPLVTRALGFHPWYLVQLPIELRATASQLLAAQKQEIARLGCPFEVEQYYLPLGTLVACRETWGLPALVYICELRSTKFVHPTLRQVVRKIATWASETIEIPIHADHDPDDFDVRRGAHDIVAKEEGAK